MNERAEVGRYRGETTPVMETGADSMLVTSDGIYREARLAC